jgi:hypothetical protein
MWRNFLMFAGCIPGLVLMSFIFADRWRRKRAGERAPQKEKLLRPAGYSLSLRLTELEDAFSVWMIMAFLTSLASVGVIAPRPSRDSAPKIIVFTVFGLGAAASTVMAWRTRIKLRSYRLGLLGEQSVAEQLQHLLANGCRVFHDIPGDGNWNIDHVVVGPAGVFAIETKSRTKRRGRTGQRDYEVLFDGNAIRCPNFTDTNTPQQARRSAKWLAAMLSKSTGTQVAVRPIVALPGWLVTLKANSDLKVLSGKQVPGFISAEPAKLSDKAIQQISYQLEQRCRDVEF